MRKADRMNRTYNNVNIIKFLLSICIPLMYIFAVWKATGLYFETNDDKFIADILSGTLTGEPDAHTIYVNYLLSYPLSLLYHVSVQIPWYGGMFVLCHFMIYAALLYNIRPQNESVLQYAVYTGLVCCFALIDIYMTAAVQFTSTAALLAVTGYLCLLLQKNPRKGLLFFFFFELMAFLLRSQSMLMIQPLGGAAYVGLCLIDRDNNKKEQWQKIIRMLLSVGLVFILGLLGNLIGYHGKEWETYTRFNNACTELFDYYEYSAYEEIKPILDKYDVTQTEYEAFYNYVILDWDVSAECSEELAQYAESQQKSELNVINLLGQIWNPIHSRTYLRTYQVAGIVFAWISILLWVFLWRKFYLLIPLGGIAISKTIVWGYLLYRGRLPLRITMPLFTCEIFLLAALLVWDYSRRENNIKQKIFSALTFTVFAAYSLLSGNMQYRQALHANGWQELYMQGLVVIQSYCEEHPDNRYLLDCWSFSYYQGSVFETRIYGNQNYVYTGGWFSNSPMLRQHLKDYFEGHEENIYLIVCDTENTNELPCVAFLTEKSGRNPILIDKITVSHGGSYLVLYFGT